jgi:hypothetical protein
MEGVSQAEGLVPRDKYILLIDNRQEQRLVRIADTKYFAPHPGNLIGARHPSRYSRSRNTPSLPSWRWETMNSRR